MKKNPTQTFSSTHNRGYSRLLTAIWSVVLLVAVFTVSCKKDKYVALEGVCPVVVTDPMDKAVDVVLTKVITATFNTPMDAASITKATFIIKQGAIAISGTVAATTNAAVYTFTPDVPLLPFTVYTGTITTGAADKFHTALVNDYVWTFTTIPQVTVTANPVIGGTTTGAGTFAQGATATVTGVPNTGYTFTNWTENAVVVSTSSSYQFTIAGNKALVANFTAIPIGKFALNLTSLPVAGGTTSGSGSFNIGSFVTATAAPNTGYSFVNWTEGANIVSTSTSYSFTLTGNRTLVANYAVLAAGKFAVTLSSNPAIGGTTSGSGSFTAGSSVTVNAAQNLGYIFTNWTEGANIVSTSPGYTFALNASRALVANFTPVAAIGPGVINLGLAGNFTILTKTGISTTGITSVGGNIGVSPAAATSITGFGLIMNTDGQSAHTPIVTGSVFAADYAAPTPSNMTTAVSDMETAYTTANGLVTPAPVVGLGAGNISGLILPPGLYKWNSGVLITNAGVTLSGGPNDTWVLQIAANLTVDNSAQITLLGGAQAKNIFWVVSSQATLGTNVNFKGNILSKTLISLNTGTTVTGRLLAQSAVTLNASTVILP
jgi:hypothetical protein